MASFAVVSGDTLHFIDVDITGLVQDWASGAQRQHGLARGGVESGVVNVIFDTKNAPDEPRAGAGGGAGDSGAPGPPARRGRQAGKGRPEHRSDGARKARR